MNREIAPSYRQYLKSRSEPLLESRHRLTWRGFFVGSFLSFFLAVSAPYSNMVIKGAYVAADISTPGAIFVFVVLIGLLNLAFKLAARGKRAALALALALAGAWLHVYWPLSDVDVHSPGLIFSTFAVVCALGNVPLAWSGRSLALNRAELIMVYAMLAMVSAVCTHGSVRAHPAHPHGHLLLRLAREHVAGEALPPLPRARHPCGRRRRERPVLRGYLPARPEHPLRRLGSSRSCGGRSSCWPCTSA